ncbi:MAG: hypothetical protein GTN78_05975 [Gemmatimonadales bacterium]|nr:hypothetical protein [Gemmatimonadales bacterium]NIN13275.1 hypothetical protein [Gemmatimonadales bacterium]NIQ99736.1 hypothetical protein [Gemmatimonadales bacterium]NIS64233.1 hypothetical protein [Gemmatimonadales bacterium]
MAEHEDIIQRAAEVLKEPVRIDPALDKRVMAAIETSRAPRAGTQRVWAAVDWLRRGRPVTVSPLGGLALAAGLAAVLLVGRWWLAGTVGQAPVEGAQAAVMQFVVVAPGAATVSLVGDFNDWSTSATPMQVVEGNGIWSVTVPLGPGRYRYAFLVDGSTWLSDPSAPRALEDDFGRPNSVVTVGGL